MENQCFLAARHVVKKHIYRLRAKCVDDRTQSLKHFWEITMERPLGAFEQSFWLYDQAHPVHFVLAAKLDAVVNVEQLRHALQNVQQRHPLLRVRIDLSRSGAPVFIEQPAEIPIRVVDPMATRIGGGAGGDIPLALRTLSPCGSFEWP
jgi:hypothetical protein